MSYVVEMTAQARTDLRSIYEYIAFALHSRINADRQLDCIEREITGFGQWGQSRKLFLATSCAPMLKYLQVGFRPDG